MNKNKPKYLKLFEELKNQILTGKLLPGDKLPSENDLCKLYDLSRITSKKAMDMLSEEKLIERKTGLGSFVLAQTTSLQKETNIQRTIVFIQPFISDVYGRDMLVELQDLTRRDNTLLICFNSHNDSAIESQIIKSLNNIDVDGYIICPARDETFNMEFLKLIVSETPLVLIDRYLRDIKCPFVISDNVTGSKMAIKHLQEMGHKKIGIITRTIDNTSALKERYKGIMQQLKEVDPLISEIPLIEIDAYSSEEIERKKMKEGLAKYKDCTAFFSTEYYFIPLFEMTCKEMGFNIPNDFSIITFDFPGKEFNLLNNITHIKQDEKKIVSTAYNLLKKIVNKNDYSLDHEIEVHIIKGDTVKNIN